MALEASVEARVFIWARTSRSWAGGRVLRVREMASGQLRPCGRSTPRGRGGRDEALELWGCCCDIETPLEGGGCW